MCGMRWVTGERGMGMGGPERRNCRESLVQFAQWWHPRRDRPRQDTLHQASTLSCMDGYPPAHPSHTRPPPKHTYTHTHTHASSHTHTHTHTPHHTHTHTHPPHTPHLQSQDERLEAEHQSRARARPGVYGGNHILRRQQPGGGLPLRPFVRRFIFRHVKRYVAKYISTLVKRLSKRTARPGHHQPPPLLLT